MFNLDNSHADGRFAVAVRKGVMVTLNITVLASELTYQSADFRLIGQPESEKSPKITMLSFPTFTGFVTYAGIGSYGNKDISSWVAEWLTGNPDLSLEEAAGILCTKGSNLLAAIKRANGKLWDMTFVLAGFDREARPIAFVISNHENARQEHFPLEAKLKISSRRLGSSRKATVIVTGNGMDWVTEPDRRSLGGIVARYPHDSERIRRRLEVLHQKAYAAEAVWAKKRGRKCRITPHCMVVSCRNDGSGVLRLDPSAESYPVFFPHVMSGVNVTDLLTKGLSEAGLDLDRIRIVQGAFAGPFGRKPRRSLPACTFTVHTPEPDKGYRLREIKADDGSSLHSARAINDNGVIAGTAEPHGERVYHAPWVWRVNHEVRIYDIAGSASAINDAGDVAMQRQNENGRSQACIWSSNAIIDLHSVLRPADSFSPTSSWTSVINAHGLVGGCVEDRSTEERQRHPMVRPAYWTVQGAAILETPGYSDCRFVSANADGTLLAMASVGPFDTRCLLWNRSDQTTTYVGGANVNIYPIGLTDSGVILGQVNNERGQKVAVIGSADRLWHSLGTPDGWAPVDINVAGDVVGRAQIDGRDRPWLRLHTGEIFMLPYVVSHNTIPSAINNVGQIAGNSSSDHGNHAVMWEIDLP